MYKCEILCDDFKTYKYSFNVTHLYLHTAQILRASIQDDTTERCEKL